MTALRALVERGHGFICGPDLYLHEVGPLMAAPVAAVDRDLVHMLPGLLAAEHVVDLLAVQLHLLLEGARHHEHVGTGLAEETELVALGAAGVRFLYQ